MNIEISGVWPSNKGAVLMLEAIKEQLRQALPSARLVAPLTWDTQERLRHGLWGTDASKSLLRTSRLLDLLPTKVRLKAGYLRAGEIDVLLDASGFGYGDFWGAGKLESRLTARLKTWRKGSRKAILLPQALGPFTKPGMADAFARAVDMLDLVFVRDAVSAKYVEDVAPGRMHVRSAPDFTNLLHPVLPERLVHLTGRSVVIPNEKMVTGKGADVRATYLAFLKTAVVALQEAGTQPFILVHEGAKDRALAQELNALLPDLIDVVDEPSALDTKAVIAATSLTVSSRFHGLVSSLSSGVPSLACGWTHKYRELMADYGCENMAVELDDRDSWQTSLDRLIGKIDDQTFLTTLKANGDRQRSASERMWESVIAVIRQAQPNR